MEAHDYDGEHQPDLKLLVKKYEDMLQEGGISFLEIDSFLMLTDYYEEENNFNLALEVLSYAIQQHPFSGSLYVRKAQLLSEIEQYGLALKALDQAVIYEPSDLDIYLTKTDIYMRMFKQDKALEVLREAKNFASEEDLSDLYVLQSTIYETKKDYQNALKYLKLALKKEPTNDVALSRLWGIYDMDKDYSDAISFHLDFINANPYSYWAWYNIGLAYMHVGLIEKAAESFDYAVVINEKFEPAYHYYIDCLLALEDFNSALRYLEEYKEHFEGDSEMWFRFGQCYEQQGNYPKARGYYAQALDYNNLGGQVYYHIGNCYIEENLWDLAEKAFLQAYTTDKFNEEYCLALGDTYDALGNSEKAHDFYHKAISIAPKEVTIWVHYIEFLIDEESYALALEMIDEAQECINDTLLDYAFAAVLLDSGRRQEGFLVLGQALLDDYDLSINLFQIAPKLEEDPSIMAFIANYKSED